MGRNYHYSRQFISPGNFDSPSSVFNYLLGRDIGVDYPDGACSLPTLLPVVRLKLRQHFDILENATWKGDFQPLLH